MPEGLATAVQTACETLLQLCMSPTGWIGGAASHKIWGHLKSCSASVSPAAAGGAAEDREPEARRARVASWPDDTCHAMPSVSTDTLVARSSCECGCPLSMPPSGAMLSPWRSTSTWGIARLACSCSVSGCWHTAEQKLAHSTPGRPAAAAGSGRTGRPAPRSLAARWMRPPASQALCIRHAQHARCRI